MKKNIFNTVVSFNCHGYRVDKFLQSQLKEFSRTRIQNLIADGQVKIDNNIVILYPKANLGIWPLGIK